MKVLSLFDGMSGGLIALTELGVKPDIYFASEIDKFAIGQSKLNFPDTVHLGSVVNVYPELLEDIDLLTGGSPCQSFSFAGKRVGMKAKNTTEFTPPSLEEFEEFLYLPTTGYLEYDDYVERKRVEFEMAKEHIEILTLEHYLQLKDEGFEFEGYSYLFWEYMRILTDIRQYNSDVLFLLENVEMGKKWEKVLTDAIGVPGIHINSAKVSAQNRKRIYWTNIPNVAQPSDRGILLRDILEEEVEEKYYLSNLAIGGHDRRKDSNQAKGNGFSYSVIGSLDKMNTLTSRYYKDGKEGLVKTDRKGNPKRDQDKAGCLTAGAHSGGNHSDMDLLLQIGLTPFGNSQDQKLSPLDGQSQCLSAGHFNQPKIASMVGRKLDGNGTRADNDPTIVAQQRLELRCDEKTGCLTSVQKDNLLIEGSREIVQLNPSKESNGNQPYQQNRVYGVDGITPALCAELGGRMNTMQSARIRRLTPTECARLQTVPAWYKWGCSATQQYKMLGNGWTIEVIKHIFSFIPGLVYNELD